MFTDLEETGFLEVLGDAHDIRVAVKEDRFDIKFLFVDLDVVAAGFDIEFDLSLLDLFLEIGDRFVCRLFRRFCRDVDLNLLADGNVYDVSGFSHDDSPWLCGEKQPGE
jgi:hypothetical protein